MKKTENIVRFEYWGQEYVLMVNYLGSLAQSFNADLILFGVELSNLNKNCLAPIEIYKKAEEFFVDKGYEVFAMK